VEKVLYCCRFVCQDVENFGEDEVCFSNHHIPRNTRISECYFDLLQMIQVIHLSFKMSVLQTWAIAQAIIDTLLPIVKHCVLNQNVSYWLDALYSAFTLYMP